MKLLQRLQEARNVGEWLEARIHLMFTEIADGMFGDGRLTRDERIALSGAIGDALGVFREVIESQAKSLYSRDPTAPIGDREQMVEAADIAGDYVPLVERAIRRDGTIPVKVIAPGWGSSGYYSPEVLERDGPKVFTPGVKMFWNHPTAVEESDRPEGDLNALAAELTSPAKWDANGPQGAGLYADAKVFGPYREAVDELAEHIGVSIRASGKATAGEAEGQRGAIIQEITNARSIDFVTAPGAGGRIIQMFEAARQPGHRSERETANSQTGDEAVSAELTAQLQEAQTRLSQLEQQNARLSEALILQGARDYVREQLAGANVPEMTRARLQESLSANPIIVDGALDREAYAARIAEAVKAEVEYLTTVAGYGQGRIEGMGSSQSRNEPTAEQINARMTEGFQRLGMSEIQAGQAAIGRRF